MSETETKVKPDVLDGTPAEEPERKSEAVARKRTESEQSEGSESNPDIHFDPIIQLPLIDLKTLEENETEILKLRAKLYRYDTSEDEPQFKERGTGEVKLLRHNQLRAVRILMRRDKTLKLCANHYIMPGMDLKQHMANEKALIWSTFADLSDQDEPPKPETLVIRFGSVENANKFRDAFEEARKFIEEDADISKGFSRIEIKDDKKKEENGESSEKERTKNEDKPKDKENAKSDE